MHFDLVDAVIEQSAPAPRDQLVGARIVTIKQVTAAEEYLGDHFPGFPVLPGVMMIEAMVQAGRRLLEPRADQASARLVLGGVRAIKYGRFVRPGETLRVEVAVQKVLDGGAFELKGEATVISPAAAGAGNGGAGGGGAGAGGAGGVGGVAVSGRFILRPIRPGLADTPSFPAN